MKILFAPGLGGVIVRVHVCGERFYRPRDAALARAAARLPGLRDVAQKPAADYVLRTNLKGERERVERRRERERENGPWRDFFIDNRTAM